MKETLPSERRIRRRKRRNVVFALRWQLLPAVFVGAFGGIGALGVLIKGGAMVYYNVKLGPIADSGGVDRAFDNIALTGANVGAVGTSFVVAWAGLMGARRWMDRDYGVAGLATVIMFGAMIAGGLIQQSKSNGSRRVEVMTSVHPSNRT